ncbi:hypothetical protein D9615_007631 [Tricholomella constricta]|uniref:Uncharacterized protein n=1 Tax=Tricholomella constricta TaxID=117010 RepID=A0A8H5H7M1_9AGAR|nr:hypothetical protein D9615_007631 [Tricholomella constricta]
MPLITSCLRPLRDTELRFSRSRLNNRHILTDEFPEMDLKDILGTPKGLEVFSKFLDKSGAFTKTGNPRAKPTAPTIEDERDREVDQAENWWERFERTGRGNTDDERTDDDGDTQESGDDEDEE